MSDYYGIKPVTKADAKMAKKHHKLGIKLDKQIIKVNEAKVEDHQKAAKKTTGKSRTYNLGHAAPHRREAAAARRDITERQRSLKTLSKLKFISG